MKKTIEPKKKTRKEQELEQRRAYILSCAEELIAELGYDATSMAMIAEKSEFAMGTVYNFFQSKSEIYNGIVLLKLSEAHRELIELNREICSSDEKLKKLISNTMDFFARNENFVKIYLYELTRLGWGLSSNLGEEVEKSLFEIIHIIEGIFQSGQKEKIIRKDIDYQKITVIHLEIMISYLACWIQEGKTSDLRSFSNEIYEILMNGIGASK